MVISETEVSLLITGGSKSAWKHYSDDIHKHKHTHHGSMCFPQLQLTYKYEYASGHFKDRRSYLLIRSHLWYPYMEIYNYILRYTNHYIQWSFQVTKAAFTKGSRPAQQHLQLVCSYNKQIHKSLWCTTTNDVPLLAMHGGHFADTNYTFVLTEGSRPIDKITLPIFIKLYVTLLKLEKSLTEKKITD